MTLLRQLIIVATLLSLIGGCFTFTNYIVFPDLRKKTSLTFAMWLAVGSWGYCCLTFLQQYAYNNHTVCVLFGIIETYANLVSIFTTVVVADSMRKVFLQRRSDNFDVKITDFHKVFVWGTPLILALLPLTTSSYGLNGVDDYCWIKTEYDDKRRRQVGFLWMAGIFYIPLLVAVVFNTAVYIMVSLRIRSWQRSNAVTARRVAAVVDRIKWYPIILVLVYIFPVFHRVAELNGSDHTWYDDSNTLSLKIQGFLDAVAYGMSPAVLSKWRKLIIGDNNESDKPDFPRSRTYSDKGLVMTENPLPFETADSSHGSANRQSYPDL